MNPSEQLDSGEGGPLILSRATPLETAKQFRRQNYLHPAPPDKRPFPTIWFSGGFFYLWGGAAYVRAEDQAIRKGLYSWLSGQLRKPGPKDEVEAGGVPFQPKKGDVDQVADALKALCHIPPDRPAWIGNDECPVDRLLVARNGIFDLSGEGDELLCEPTPRLFTANALTYDYLSDALEPLEWLRFLDTLWPDDPESVELLQDWMGYVLSQETRQQKILLIVGPPRAGKGTIAAVMREMIGEANVCAPTLSGLSNEFGLEPLLDKTLAIISDARLSSRSDQAVITERLLTVSGEDAVTVNRKFRDALTVKLRARFTLMTNELPKLSDSSGALANRFVVLRLTQTFLGKEDKGLLDRLRTELPSILRWSIAGWRRLQERGHFVQPTTSQQAINELNDLASPIGAFIRECCAVKEGYSAEIGELYDLWVAWCQQQGRAQPGDAQRFGRDLRAAVPGLESSQRRVEGVRSRFYEGIGITLTGRKVLSDYRGSHLAA